MSAPNIVNVSSIYGKTALAAPSGSPIPVETLVNNAASSNKVLKINTLYAANADGSTAIDATVAVHNEDDGGGTGYEIASTISVPADGTLIVIDKNSPIYLEEDMSITVTAGAAGLKFVASYEEIDDA